MLQVPLINIIPFIFSDEVHIQSSVSLHFVEYLTLQNAKYLC